MRSQPQLFHTYYGSLLSPKKRQLEPDCGARLILRANLFCQSSRRATKILVQLDAQRRLLGDLHCQGVQGWRSKIDYMYDIAGESAMDGFISRRFNCKVGRRSERALRLGTLTYTSTEWILDEIDSLHIRKFQPRSLRGCFSISSTAV